MYGRIVTLSILAAHSAGISSAAERQLRDLVMPDAKVLAGLNMDRLKATALGRYALTQIARRSTQVQQMTTYFGIDPSRSVKEMLFASNGTTVAEGGVLVARGKFNAAAIRSSAERHGAIAERYNGTTILTDPKLSLGLALLSSTIAAAGDLASVKAVVDRE